MLRRLITCYTTPGGLPAWMVFAGGILAILLIATIDFLTNSHIRLSVLYVFPLAAIAFHCEQKHWVVAGFVLALACAFTNEFRDVGGSASFDIDTGIFILTAILTVFMASAARQNYVLAMNIATTDWLTGLHNRRGFEAVADLEIARQKRYGGVFSLALIDLDDFKHLNDSRGHHVGDDALKLLAAILQEHTRQTDSAARLGGDEFAILMPNTRKNDCDSICQQLALKIAARMADEDFAITASIGCTTIETPPGSVSEVLKRADKAMYSAKQNGKSCAVSL